MTLSAKQLLPHTEAAFRRFLAVTHEFPSRVGTDSVKWAFNKTASVVKQRVQDYADSDAILAEVLRFLDELAAKQTLQEPSPDESSNKQTRVLGTEKRKTTAIKKVCEPGRAQVNEFIQMMSGKGHRITRKAISEVAGYRCRSELWRFETGKRCTAAARTTFNRVLGLTPEEFTRKLTIKSGSK